MKDTLQENLNKLYEIIDKPSFHEDMERTTIAEPEGDIGTEKYSTISASPKMIRTCDNPEFPDTNLVLPGNKPENISVNLSREGRIIVQWTDDGQRHAIYIQSKHRNVENKVAYDEGIVDKRGLSDTD